MSINEHPDNLKESIRRLRREREERDHEIASLRAEIKDRDLTIALMAKNRTALDEEVAAFTAWIVEHGKPFDAGRSSLVVAREMIERLEAQLDAAVEAFETFWVSVYQHVCDPDPDMGSAMRCRIPSLRKSMEASRAALDAARRGEGK